jgi:hypothetical protein
MRLGNAFADEILAAAGPASTVDGHGDQEGELRPTRVHRVPLRGDAPGACAASARSGSLEYMLKRFSER